MSSNLFPQFRYMIMVPSVMVWPCHMGWCFTEGLTSLCCSRKYPYPSHGRFFKLNPPTHPSGNSILVSYFHSKNWAFETPLPLGISTVPPWGGHAYFLKLHIAPFPLGQNCPRKNTMTRTTVYIIL